MSGLVHKDPQSISRKISVAPMMDWIGRHRRVVDAEMCLSLCKRLRAEVWLCDGYLLWLA